MTAFESLLFRLLVKFWGFISAKAVFLWFPTRYIKKQKLFPEGFAFDYLWPSLGMVKKAGTPSKKIRACWMAKFASRARWAKEWWSAVDGLWQWWWNSATCHFMIMSLWMWSFQGTLWIQRILQRFEYKSRFRIQLRENQFQYLRRSCRLKLNDALFSWQWCIKMNCI